MTLSLEQLRRCSVAVDFGASRTRVYLRNSGLIVDEPSVAAVNVDSGSLLAVGEFAERMAGRTPRHIRVVRPIRDGTVVDIDMAQRMVKHLLGDKLRRAWRRKPTLRAAVCLPYDADPLARRAAEETLSGLGARQVGLVDALIAAAVGSGLSVEQPEASLIVLGGVTTTQVAVLSMGAIVAAERAPVGGHTVDRALAQYLRDQHELLLPGQLSQPLRSVLNTVADPTASTVDVHGRDVATGLARTARVDADEVRQTILVPLTAVLDGIRAVLRESPPDLVADLAERGIMLAGGSALLPGLDGILHSATGIPVHIADAPDVCAVRGLGAMIEGRVEPLRLGRLPA